MSDLMPFMQYMNQPGQTNLNDFDIGWGLPGMLPQQNFGVGQEVFNSMTYPNPLTPPISPVEAAQAVGTPQVTQPPRMAAAAPRAAPAAPQVQNFDIDAFVKYANAYQAARRQAMPNQQRSLDPFGVGGAYQDLR